MLPSDCLVPLPPAFEPSGLADAGTRRHRLRVGPQHAGCQVALQLPPAAALAACQRPSGPAARLQSRERRRRLGICGVRPLVKAAGGPIQRRKAPECPRQVAEGFGRRTEAPVRTAAAQHAPRAAGTGPCAVQVRLFRIEALLRLAAWRHFIT